MKIYWTLKSIPELADLTPAERTVVWYTCKSRAWRHWQTWVGASVAVLVSLALGAFALLFLREYLVAIPGLTGPARILARYFIAGFACGGLVVGLASYLIGLVVASQVRPHLRDYLKDGGINPEDLEG